MKIALIELGGAHDECLYSQLKFLKSHESVEVTLICNESLAQNIAAFDLANETLFFEIGTGMKGRKDIRKIAKLCREKGYEKIIFNTAQGKTIAKFLSCKFPKNVEFYGTLHGIEKLNGSGTQKRISKKVKNYFLLHEYLKEKVTPVSGQKFEVFYPIYFPDYTAAIPEKAENEIWICIPGQVELKRREYNLMFDSLAKQGLKENIKIILLGRCEHAHGDGSYVKEQIKKLNLSENFMLWDNFISIELFHTIAQNSDYILPLIHSNETSGNLYNNQISGAFNIAAGYYKPMLIENTFAENHFKNNEVIHYEKNNLMEVVNSLSKEPFGNFYSDNKWSFDEQRKKYLTFVGLME